MSSQPLSSRSRVKSSRGNEPVSPGSRRLDGAAGDVDGELERRVGDDGVEQGPPHAGLDLHGQQPLLRAVVAEDVGEARRHHGLEPVVEQRPHGVLPGRARPEVRARHEDGGARRTRGWFRTKSRSSRHSEKRPAPNPVRSTRLSQSDGMIWSVSTSERSRGTARPVTTVTGFTTGPRGWRSVRPRRWRRPRRARPGGCARPGPGGPRSCGSRSTRSARPTASLSGFMARHIEQPGSRHSKPAARNTLSRPSASAWAFTGCDPGTTRARSPWCT